MNKLTILAALAAALLICVTTVLAQDATTEKDLASAEKTEAGAQENEAGAEENEAGAEEGVAAVEQQIAPKNKGFSIYLGDTFGAGLIIIGAAYGIGRIGACAVESMARQPEVAGSIQTAMIIAAALIEGVTFFGLIICLLAVIM